MKTCVSPSGIVVFIGLLQTCLVIVTIYRTFPVHDEWMHLPSGLNDWQYRRFEFYRVNPPLVRLLASLPAFMTGHTAPPLGYLGPNARMEPSLATNWINSYGKSTIDQIRWGRLLLLPIGWLGIWTVYQIAENLYGGYAATVPVALFAMSPAVLASGALITPDLSATVALLLNGYLFDLFLRKPQVTSAMIVGLCLGISMGVKSTFIFLPCLWLLMVAIAAAVKFTPIRAIGLMLLASCISIVVLNGCYCFDETMHPLGEFEFRSRSLTIHDGEDRMISSNRYSETWLATFPVPLPADFVRGIDMQKNDFETGIPCFFMGRWYPEGRWTYYLAAMALKEPLPFWIALTIGISYWSSVPLSQSARLSVHLIPAILLFALASSQFGIQRHYRYVLPALPIMMIVGAGSVCGTNRWQRAIAGTAIAASLAIGVFSVPRPHSYFSSLAGGSDNGWRCLTHSHVDWGQDTQIIVDFLDKRAPVGPCFVICSTNWDLRLLGWNATSDPQQFMTHEAERDTPVYPRIPGLYVVSPTKYVEPRYRYFLHRRADGELAGQIRIFTIDEVEVLSLHSRSKSK